MEPISAEEKKQFQDFLSFLYGDQAYQWNINLPVLKLLEELLRKNDYCSQYMDKVPRPFYFGRAIRWISKQARQAVIKHLQVRNKSYYLCLKGAALSMKMKFQLASMGI